MMVWKSGFIVFFLIWQYIPATAQYFSIQVLDKENEFAIPFATGRWSFSKEIIFSDVNGLFILKEQNLKSEDTLFIYHVGFMPTFITGFEPNKRKELKVLMNANVIELKGPTVSENSPITMIKNVKIKLKSSIPKRSIVQPSFYRQYHVEDNKGVFFLEAMVLVNFGKGLSKQLKVDIENLRRIPTSERNREQHSDHLMDLLYANPIYNAVGGPLHAQFYSDFRWSFGILPEDSSEFTKLNFVERMDDGVNNKCGSLIIRNSDYSILKYSTYFARMGDYDLDRVGSSEKFIWLKMEEKLEFNFEWLSDSIYLKSAQQEYTHYLISKVFRSVDHELKENFYWEMTDPFYMYSDSLDSFKQSSNLYSQKFRFEDQVWSTDMMRDLMQVESQDLLMFGGQNRLDENFRKGEN